MKSVMKRIVSIVLELCLCLIMLPYVSTVADAEYTWITDRNEVDGYDFTKVDKLAKKLNAIFDGNASVYADQKCTQLVNTRIGLYAVPNNDVTQYVGPYGGPKINSGTSCWIYANGVYYTLFGECTGNGTPGQNSEKLNLSSTSNKKATYNNFKTWGVRDGVGALIRADGHSMIVMDYDEEQLTILDGNGDKKGRISLRVRSWDEIGFTVSYIIQPKEDYFNSLYPVCEQHYFTNCFCEFCGKTSPELTNYLNQCTQKIDTKIRVKTTKAGTFKTLPCSSNTNSASVDVVSFSAGESFTVTKIIKNTEGNYWYAVNIDGYDRYVYSTYTQFGFSFGASVENKVYPVSINQGSSFGIDADFASDNFIYTVIAEVYSGSGVTSGTPVISSSVASIAKHSFDVKGSNVNKNLSFGKLPVGKYTYVLKYNYYYYHCEDNKLKITYTEMTPILTKSFEVVSSSSSHSHSYNKTVIDATCTEGGYTLYECACGDFYENDWSTSYGHNPGSAATCTAPQKCSRCGVTLKEATGHKYTSVITYPTCTAKGYTTYTCVCGDTYKCDYTAELGHSYNKTVTAPTCTSTGYTHYDCSRCSKEYYADYTDMVGHKWDSGEIIKEPTVDEKGVKSYSCKTCKLIRKEDIEKLDFVIGDVDLDGKVTAADARLSLRCSVGLENYSKSSKQFSACDADSDGKVTASDARKILRFSVGLEKSL